MSEQSAKAESLYTEQVTAIREAAKPGDLKPTRTPPEIEMAEDADARPDRMRFALSLLVAMMTQAVLFGIGMVAILATPLADSAGTLVWPMIAAATVLGLIAGWVIAPRLRARNWATRRAREAARRA